MQMKANYENLKTIEVRTPGTDLNDYIENGDFFFNNANTPLNKPSDVLQQAGYLKVFARNSNTLVHIWIEYGNYRIWQRQKVNGNWGNWFKLGEEKNFLVAYPENDLKLSVTGTLTTWKMTATKVKHGSKLSLNSNGEIVIGKGIKSIKVSGHVYYYTGTNGSKSIEMRSNHGIITRTNESNIVNYTMIVIPENIIEVSEGDKIFMQINGTKDDLFKAYDFASYMIVEVLD